MKEQIQSELMNLTGLPFSHDGLLLSMSQYSKSPSASLSVLSREKESLKRALEETIGSLDTIGNSKDWLSQRKKVLAIEMYRQLNKNLQLIGELTAKFAKLNG